MIFLKCTHLIVYSIKTTFEQQPTNVPQMAKITFIFMLNSRQSKNSGNVTAIFFPFSSVNFANNKLSQ